MADMVIGHGRFDPYGNKTKLEIVGEPLDLKKFKKDKKEPEIIDADDYNLFMSEKPKPKPTVERSKEAETITLPVHTLADLEIIEVQIGGKTYSIPRWMAKYMSGPC